LTIGAETHVPIASPKDVHWSRPEKVDKKGVKVSTPVKNIFFGILGFILFNIEREP